MFYAKREDNFRLRSLKYARKYLHVEALFWGPITETSSGFVAFQNINGRSVSCVLQLQRENNEEEITRGAHTYFIIKRV